MHRVELKVFVMTSFNTMIVVPNAPCGVESSGELTMEEMLSEVPNAPCGVERSS